MAASRQVISIPVLPQPSPETESDPLELLAEIIDESVEFGDVGSETREMVEADFFESLRGGTL